MKDLMIQRKGGKGRLAIWEDQGEIYIRESLERGKDVQTVCLSPEELAKLQQWITKLRLGQG